VIEDASPEVLAQIQAVLAASGRAKLVHSGHPHTTLERLFLEVTDRQE